MRIYEVFLKRDGRDEFRHAGSLEAADDDTAGVLAVECYARRAEGDRMWLVDRDDIVVVDPALIAPNRHKAHRHNDGAAVAEHRRSRRDPGTGPGHDGSGADGEAPR